MADGRQELEAGWLVPLLLHCYCWFRLGSAVCPGQESSCLFQGALLCEDFS